jgi:hypothetical protein
VINPQTKQRPTTTASASRSAPLPSSDQDDGASVSSEPGNRITGGCYSVGPGMVAVPDKHATVLREELRT